jgi:hypothetical protein
MVDCDWEDESADGGGTMWLWTDGNFCCDCNRYLFFQRAANKDEIDDDCRCGDSAYSVLGIELPCGRCIPVYDHLAERAA